MRWYSTGAGEQDVTLVERPWATLVAGFGPGEPRSIEATQTWTGRQRAPRSSRSGTSSIRPAITRRGESPEHDDLLDLGSSAADVPGRLQPRWHHRGLRR
ncbi:MAG: hypothetical protein U5Q44_04820 [Dehalococcoidia bacterium]|nr:hypothetical protein [Dehalococcoidia bacterium]